MKKLLLLTLFIVTVSAAFAPVLRAQVADEPLAMEQEEDGEESLQKALGPRREAVIPQEAQKEQQSAPQAQAAQDSAENKTAAEPQTQQAKQNLTPAQNKAEAAELYNHGDYLGASQAYNAQAAQSTLPSPYTYYNLANSYFKSGDPDKAIVYYYRAFRMLPRDKDIKRNLSFALNSTGQRLLPEGVPQTAFDAFYLLSAEELRGMLWFLGWIFAIAFAVYMSGHKREICKKAVAVSGVLFMAFGIWYIARTPGDSSPLAVVVVSRAEVRSGPGENFPVSLSVPRSHLVTVSDRKGTWTEIELPSEKATGWVLNKSIEEI